MSNSFVYTVFVCIPRSISDNVDTLGVSASQHLR